MATVNDYLKKLLYQYDCVVVPELGAFLTHYQPAAFTESSGLYFPPRKRVAFNEALRFDDGILANYIMLHEPLTREGAQQHIRMFVEELRQQVDAVGRFEIDGVGTFTFNDEGRLQFDPSLRHNFFGEAYGMSVLSAGLVNRQPKLEPALEAVPMTTALGPVLIRDEDTTLTPYHPTRPYWRVAAIILLVGSLGAISYFSVINPGQPLQSSLDPANLLRIPASFLNRLISVSEAPKLGSVHNDTPLPVSINKPKPAVVSVESVPVASPKEPVDGTSKSALKVKLDVASATTSEPSKGEFASTVKPVRTSPYFTVIAGSFSSKRNAMRLKRQLRKAGYTDAFVIMPSQKGQLYKVAAAGSAIRTEAVASMAPINELAGTESWIFKN